MVVYSVKTGDKPLSDHARYVEIGEREREKEKANRENEAKSETLRRDKLDKSQIWKRVSALVDFKTTRTEAKDTSRMRQVLFAVKN